MWKLKLRNLHHISQLNPVPTICFLILLFFLLAYNASFTFGSSRKDPPASIHFTPIGLKVMVPPQTFPGSDGLRHLVYELQLINGTSRDWEIKSLEVFNKKNPQKVLQRLEGVSLKERTSLIGLRDPISKLGPHQSAIIWIHLEFKPKGEIPNTLEHRLSLRSGDQSVTEHGAVTKVVSTAPPILDAPLKGGRWVAADGCCDSIRHVRALLPVNGGFFTAQRYAIDWELLGPEGRIYNGDKLEVKNYHCYGQDVLAVADGTVIQTENKLPNQVPGKLPDKISPKDADGNHVVLKIGAEQYALYAHLMPGSVRVKPGQTVRRGQLLGKVGNSGNTSEPHLHFHLMDGPSPLASSGLPYVLKEFKVLGQVPSTEAFDKAAADGSPIKIIPSKSPKKHFQQYPMDQSVVDLKTPIP